MKIALSTMYNFCPDIFDFLKIPEGLDKDTLIQNIILDYGEFGVLYADGEFMKNAIKHWSSKMLDVWEKLFETMSYEYNPIHNYDRTEIRDRDVSGNSVSQETAFDSDELRVTNGGDSSGKEHEETRTLGNIGVTTTQQMIEQQRRVVEFNLFDVIMRNFADKFLLEIY